MSLEGSRRIGHYEVVELLGRGGMGEVWRARDTRLGRDVAIKALPDALAADPERMARFEREARILASLNHPGIGAIYGLEETGQRRYLVLECVEGETLAERLERGPLPVDEALQDALLIASALEAAHESGIVHRDLKPGNVKITPAGEVKVLDFGLAKGNVASAGPESRADLSQSPTLTFAVTGESVILGTAAYMSPEQARGRPVDRRTDIWSFGCILYECLTGRQLFAGETVSDMIAKILEREPDWSALPARTPERVRALLRRCLEKDPRRRLRDIGDARLELEESRAASVSGARATPAGTGRPRAAIPVLPAAAILAVISLAIFAAARIWAPSPASNPVRFSISAPAGTSFVPEPAHVAISPDGRALAFTALDSSGTVALWVRALDSYTARPLPGTENAELPFWSPDGKWIAYFANGRLKKVAVQGGASEVLCEANNGRGGSWSRRGVIVFAPSGEGPLLKVSASGGEPVPVTTLDTTRQESAHRFPCFLADGTRFLYAAIPPRQGRYSVRAGSIHGGKSRTVLEAGSGAVYAHRGHLIFRRGDQLVAQRFDPRSMRVRGEPASLGEFTAPSNFSGASAVSVSTSGALAYLSGAVSNTRLVWMNRSGREVGVVPVPEGRYQLDAWGALSPDQNRIAITRVESAEAMDIWLVELGRGIASRFTFGRGRSGSPVWSPDGRRIAFENDRDGPWDIYVKPVDGGEEEPLVRSSSAFKHPTHWSRDGRYLLFDVLEAGTGWDIWVVPMEGERKPRPFLRTRFNERFSTFSNDGRWVGYSSDESGRMEVYVQAFPGGGSRHQISIGGGFGPRFRADDRELIFGGPDGVTGMGVDIQTRPVFRSGVPRPIFRLPPALTGITSRPDFSEFLIGLQAGERADPMLNVVLDWASLMRQDR